MKAKNSLTLPETPERDEVELLSVRDRGLCRPLGKIHRHGRTSPQILTLKMRRQLESFGPLVELNSQLESKERFQSKLLSKFFRPSKKEAEKTLKGA